MEENTEVWKEIKECPGYYVSSFGRVFSLKRCRYMKGSISADGDRVLNLRVRGRKTTRKVDRLVAQAFLPSEGSGRLKVIHKDGDRLNNRLDNLSWEKSGSWRALTPEEADEIKKLYVTGKYTQEDLGKMFGVSASTIGNYSKGVKPEKRVYNQYPKITDEEADEIRRLYTTGDFTLRELSDRYGISQSAVYLTVRNSDSPRHWRFGSAEKREKAERLFRTGLYTKKEVADKIGVHHKTVKRYLAKQTPGQEQAGEE